MERWMLQLFYDSRHLCDHLKRSQFCLSSPDLGSETWARLDSGWGVAKYGQFYPRYQLSKYNLQSCAVFWRIAPSEKSAWGGVGITNECGHVTQSGYLTRVTSNEWKPKWSTKLPHSQSRPRNQWDIYCLSIALFVMTLPRIFLVTAATALHSHLSLNMDLEYLESNISRETKLISEFIKSGHRRINQAQIWSR